MGYRLSKIATRTGDDGSTGLGDGSRVPKHALRVVALGDVDELNSQLGLLLCESLPDTVRGQLTAIQNELFQVGGELAVPGFHWLEETALLRIDNWLAEMNTELPPLQEFILPGGCRSAALSHVARAMARRAERSVVALAAAEAGVSPRLQQYLNRLSDALFVLARLLNRYEGGQEVMWQKPQAPEESTQ